MERKAEWLMAHIELLKKTYLDTKEKIETKILLEQETIQIEDKIITVKEYLEYLKKEIEENKSVLEKYIILIKESNPIEADLIYYVLVLELNTSKAIKRAAERYDKSERWIWKKYYKKIKKFIEKFSKYNDKM